MKELDCLTPDWIGNGGRSRVQGHSQANLVDLFFSTMGWLRLSLLILEFGRSNLLQRGKRASTLSGWLLQSVFWIIWLERNRRIFSKYKVVGVGELWDRVKFWAALWAFVTPDFKDYSYSSILRDMAAAVT
ncbi:unnamed protein product [Prunus brigantina]